MFQSYMPGERWSDIVRELTPAEDEALWRQLGRIARTINDVRGRAFGAPYPGPTFASWSAAVLHALDATATEVER